MSEKNVKKQVSKAGAVTLTSGLIAAVAAGPVFAESGGGSVGAGGNNGGDVATHFFIETHDDADKVGNPKQGWGQNSIDYFKKEFIGARSWTSNAEAKVKAGIQESCTAAINQAIKRSNGKAKRARVVQVAGGGQKWGGGGGDWISNGAYKKDVLDWYNSDNIKNSTKRGLKNYDDKMIKVVRDEFKDHVTQNVRIVCVALNENEPTPSNYKLNISTDKGSTFSMAGTKTAVNDVIHASSTGSKKENLKAKVYLNWDGPTGKTSRMARKKEVTITNKGDTRSPNFIPSDFGWDVWPAGRFWFDVVVDKQGSMDAGINTADRDPRETWTAQTPKPKKNIYVPGTTTLVSPDMALASGQHYDAKIVAMNTGYDQMTMTDTVNTDKVYFGGTSKDDVSKIKVLGPDGKAVGAKISIDRSKKGKAIVNATVDTKNKKIGNYTLVVPTYVLPTGENYEVPDDSGVCYNGTVLCLDGDSRKTRKVTPQPDKVWVLDEKGALKAADPKHTNKEGADGKTFAPGSDISAVVNGHIGKGLIDNLQSYSITDDWTGAAKYVDFSDASKAKVFRDGKDVTSQFNIKVEGTKTIATAKPEFLKTTKGLKEDSKIKLVISGKFKNDYDTDGKTEKLVNSGSEKWNNESKQTNTPPVFTETPKPDKAWVLDEKGGLRTADPDWTNKVGADNKVFLMNDTVYAVVNGKVPKNLGRNLDYYHIVDDWTDAKKYIDFNDKSKVNVYLDGKKVTDQFDIKIENGKTTAVAKKAFLDKTANLGKDAQVKLIIGGKFKDDYDTDGKLVKMLNKGSEKWNTREQPTNTPPVFTWTPDPHKEVIASANQDGDQSNINGMSVYPGQWLEYTITPDLRIPTNRAHTIKQFAVEDTYDPNFKPNKKSLEFFDARTNKVIPKSAYTVKWNDENHSVTVEFKKDWIEKNLAENSEKGWLIMRLDGKVSMETPPGSTVKNQAFQIINHAKTETEIVKSDIPPIEPDKEDLNTFMDDIDGKNVLLGDIIRYRLTLDAGKPRSELAYDVQKLGMIDDYDDEYLDVSAENIKVYEMDSGADVTDKFNVGVEDGVAYAFAKHVDRVNSNGEEIKGEQPKSLAEYRKKTLDPVEDPIIDQSLLGKKYYVVIDGKVKKDTDGYVIKNQAIQNINNAEYATRIVSNPIKEINPDKDVVVDEASKDKSINDTEIQLYDTFNYRLNTSLVPGDLAYSGRHKDWSISDTFDRKHDSYTGVWAVYANSDIYNGDELIFKKGALLADSAGHESETYKDLFEAEFDEESYTFTVKATDKFMEFVNSNTKNEHAWSAYVKMERIAPGDPIVNKHTETFDGTERISNEVKTRTPENPDISVIKYDLDSGKKKGDRNEKESALELTEKQIAEGLTIGISFTNTGNVPLKDLKIEDVTHEGTTGKVENIMCAAPMKKDLIKTLNDENKDVEFPIVDDPASGAVDADKKTEETTAEKIDPVQIDPAEKKPEEIEKEANDKAPEDISEAKPEKEGDKGLMAADKINELLEDGTFKPGETIDCQGDLVGVEPGTEHADTVTVEGTSIFSDKKAEDSDDWHGKTPEIPEEPEKPEEPKPEDPKPEDPKPEDPKPEDPKPDNPEKEALPDKPTVQSGGVELQKDMIFGGLFALLVAAAASAYMTYRKLRGQKD